MSIRLEKGAASARQKRDLQRARDGYWPITQLAGEIYNWVFSDRVLEGIESLHPGWLEIFHTFKEELRDSMPRSAYERLAEEVEDLTNPGREVAEINPNEQAITFLLGAGASKPDPSGIPTVKELLPDLLARARRLDRDDVTRLADFCQDQEIDNIEDLLTAAQLAEFSSQNPNVLRLVDFLIYGREGEDSPYSRRRVRSIVDFSSVAFIQDTLQVLFGLLSSRMLPAEPNDGHVAIASYVTGQREASIITTNYDCCMDLALSSSGQIPDYLVDFVHPRNVQEESKEKSVDLIKLHGSLNWFYCETCQEVHLIDIESTVKNYLEEKAFYPVISVCKDCGGQRRGLLVPPLAMKFDISPPLNRLLERAEEALDRVNVVAVVGFSFSQADVYISRMLSKWMQTNDGAELIIFDPDPGVVKKVREQFSRRVPEFSPDRILSVLGDCSETLPSFLKGEYLEQPVELSAEASV